MKTSVIISALILSASLLRAQAPEKKTTVRIKKVENINGVEKTSDSTYAVNGPITLSEINEFSGNENVPCKDGKPKKIVIVTDEINGADADIKVIHKEDLADEQIQRALKEVGVDGKDFDADKVMIVNIDGKDTDKEGEKKITKVVIIKKIKITEPTDEDSKMLREQTGISDNKLALAQLNFYPNPNTGKFTLSFSLKDKGITEVNILNIEGKSVYNEQLQDFSGNYTKEIDISANPKGVYFVKIKQGAHAQVKKIVLE